MRHTARGLVFASFALLLGCGVNGQAPDTAPPTEATPPAQAAERDLVPGERVARPFILLTDQGKTETKPAGCRPAEPVEPVYTRKNEKVHWIIFNHCSAEVRVRVDDFTIKGQTPDGDSPFNGNPECVAAADNGHCRIRLSVKQDPPRGTPPDQRVVFVFTYNIRVNGGVVDPEMIIEWF